MIWLILPFVISTLVVGLLRWKNYVGWGSGIALWLGLFLVVGNITPWGTSIYGLLIGIGLVILGGILIRRGRREKIPQPEEQPK